MRRSYWALATVLLGAVIICPAARRTIFAGVNLSGGVVKPDIDDNTDLYGPNVAARDVVLGTTVKVPAVTEPFMKALKRAP